jgi:predicted dehydrogenase
MSDRPTRRQFIQHTAALTAGIGYISSASAQPSTAPSGKLNIAVIGVAGRGADNLSSVSGENIVALCDVDDRQLDRTAARFPNAKKYHDFRELLADPKGIDAAVISTADHSHAPASVRAMRKGLHVYSEKPLGHTVGEARLVRETYLKNKNKIATQMGTQIHAEDNYRRVVEIIQAGIIGNVTEAHVWCDRRSSQAAPPTGSAPVPKYLHWDLWVGSAPFRDYQNGYMPGNLTWNRYWDFGNGILGDMGSHLIDLPYWALNLRFPDTCHADGPAAHPIIYPDWLKVTWTHPSRGTGPHEQPCKVMWYDGSAKPTELFGIDVKGYGIGVIFVGEKGKVLADYGRRTIIMADGSKPAEPKPTIEKSKGHHQEWLAACKGKVTETLCNFDYSGALIEHNLLGVVSHRTGKKIEWDAKNLKSTNVPEADKFVNKAYRKGWEFDTQA